MVQKIRVRIEAYKPTTYQSVGEYQEEHQQILADHVGWEGEFRMNNRLMRAHYNFLVTDVAEEEINNILSTWDLITNQYSLTKITTKTEYYEI